MDSAEVSPVAVLRLYNRVFSLYGCSLSFIRAFAARNVFRSFAGIVALRMSR